MRSVETFRPHPPKSRVTNLSIGMILLLTWVLIPMACGGDDSDSPTEPDGSSIRFISTSAGGEYSCGVLDSGDAYCWGENFGGRLGNASSFDDSTTPVKVVGGLAFSWIGAGANRTCGLTTSGDAFCWGSAVPSGTPALVTGGIKWSSLSVGSVHVCGVSTSGVGYCWGDNFRGRLGDATTTSRTTPVEVAGSLTFSSISAGAGHTCGVTTGGGAYCWGDNVLGALGNGSLGGTRSVPTAVSGGLKFASISAGNSQTCGITAVGSSGGDGQLFCWGSNFLGNLGIGSTDIQTTPTLVTSPTGTKWAQVSTGAGEHTCGITTNGDLYCWGPNPDGRLGDSSTTERLVPTAVVGASNFATVTAGDRMNTGSPGLSHTCGLSRQRHLYCWGSNSDGQLGNGNTTDSAVPVRVTIPTPGS